MEPLLGMQQQAKTRQHRQHTAQPVAVAGQTTAISVSGMTASKSSKLDCSSA
jgi:hypothetical protein